MTTEAQLQASDIFQMSDEEILNMDTSSLQNNPEPTAGKTEEELAAEQAAQADAAAAEETRLAQEEADRVAAEQAEEAAQAKSIEGEDNPADTQPDNTISQVDDNGVKVAPTKVESNDGKSTTDASKPTDQAKDGEGKDKQEQVAPESNGLPADFNYKAGYEALMKPFKANGKMVQVRNADEAIALMQQGANFTRKMQEIAPHRKLIQMLQNNDLLDEGQLSFAIDLVKKNPEAIKKLVKESGIDPMDIDVNSEPQYQEGNHRVTEAEVRFQSELGDLKSTPEGNATLGVIHQTWDDASKAALFNNQGLMSTMHEQRELGIYQVIADEIEHMKTLGKIGADVPFIQAYKAVGDYLKEQGAFDALAAKKNGATTSAAVATAPAAPVATRVAQPKPAVSNGAQASAASPSRAAPRKAEALVNVLAMSDEEFLKLPMLKSI